MDLESVWQQEVKPEDRRPPMHLDMDYDSLLWDKNDMWKLMAASFNLNIHIDFLYDHIVRFMRNVIEKYPDGFSGFVFLIA